MATVRGLHPELLRMVLVASLSGCSGANSLLPPPPTVVSLGPAGGSVVFPDSAGVLVVPAGALSGNVDFSVSAATAVPASGLLVQGTAFVIEPPTEFLVPATLQLNYSAVTLPPGVQGSELAVHRVQGQWQLVEPSTVDAGARNVQASITATDTVGLLGRAATILSLSPAAADLFVGDSLRFNATPQDAAGNPLSSRAIAWSSSDPDVASVRNDGTVLGIAEGGVSITAYTDTASFSGLVEVKPRPPQSALYPNQPPGALVLMDYDTDFSLIQTPPWDVSSGTANLSRVVDPTAPRNPNTVGRVRFAPGCCGGAGPARLETFTGAGRGTPPPGWRRWYVSDWVKLANGWVANAEGQQTIFRIHVNDAGGFSTWIAFKLDGSGPFQPRVTLETPTSTTNFGNAAVSAIAGQWYHFEAVVHNMGRIQFWINNTAVYDGTPETLQFAGEFLAWSWEYGGTTPYGGTSDGYIYHNHIRVSYTTD